MVILSAVGRFCVQCTWQQGGTSPTPACISTCFDTPLVTKYVLGYDLERASQYVYRWMAVVLVRWMAEVHAAFTLSSFAVSHAHVTGLSVHLRCTTSWCA